jgi:hypothetical protein
MRLNFCFNVARINRTISINDSQFLFSTEKKKEEDEKKYEQYESKNFIFIY